MCMKRFTIDFNLHLPARTFIPSQYFCSSFLLFSFGSTHLLLLFSLLHSRNGNRICSHFHDVFIYLPACFSSTSFIIVKFWKKKYSTAMHQLGVSNKIEMKIWAHTAYNRKTIEQFILITASVGKLILWRYLRYCSSGRNNKFSLGKPANKLA